MKKENEIVKSKSNILDYLQNLNVTATNKHEEKDLDNYILSIVMITTTFNSSNEYSIYMVCEEKKSKIIYGNFFEENFNDEEKAITYYNELKQKMNFYNEKDIVNLITTL